MISATAVRTSPDAVVVVVGDDAARSINCRLILGKTRTHDPRFVATVFQPRMGFDHDGTGERAHGCGA